VENDIVSWEPNNDFAMGAPPGAAAIDEGGPMRRDTVRNRTAPDATPRAGTMDLPMTAAPTPVGWPRRWTRTHLCTSLLLQQEVLIVIVRGTIQE
jgi:hypothetical protein